MYPNNHRPDRQGRARGKLAWSLVIAVVGLGLGSSARAATHPRLVLSPAPGFTIDWDGNNGGFSNPEVGAGPSNNVALASNGTIAFGSSEFNGGGAHLIANINDGLYGNSHSWLSDFITPDPAPFIGLAFPGSTDINSIAWGRDNGDAVTDACAGTCVDRNVDTYTLQFTQVAAPDGSTVDTGDAATGWADIGTIQILPGVDDPTFTGYLRHRYEVSEAGNPISATGFRIKVMDPNTAIDEIEINPIPDPVPEINNYLFISSAEGFAITWDENEGNFSDPASPALAPDNAARAGTAFGSSEFGSGHLIANVNNGQYGNLASWIANFAAPDPNPFIGINFGECIAIQSIAWSRDNGDSVDNCCGGTATDRTLGLYTLQITARTDADASTPETGDALSGWQTIGTIDYKANDPVLFNSHLRHRFDVSAGGGPVSASAIRIKVPNPGIAIDEIEVNVNQTIEQGLITIVNGFGYSLSYDGNQGDFLGANAPDNRALASNGSTAFGSSELGGGGFHLISNTIDGNYGNSFSWISDFTLPDLDPFVGVAFGELIDISNLAFSRDNSGGNIGDRSADVYTVQITEVATPDQTTPDTDDPSTGWATVATITYAPSSGPLNWFPHLRHRFQAEGFAIPATALRIKVANGGTAIDEIEVNTGIVAPPPPDPVAPILITPDLGYEIGYDGNDGEFEDPAQGAAAPANRALATEGTVAFASSELAGFGHLTSEVNDGLYGNLFSWISGPDLGVDPDPWIALNFGGIVSITNIAWGRDNGDNIDNCCGGIVMDRSIDLYTLQHTLVENPDASTVQTDDASTGWQTIGTIDIQGNAPPLFHSYKRHRFEISTGGFPVDATGIRLRFASNATAVDEIEVNTAGPVIPTVSMEQVGGTVRVTWKGNGILEGATSIDGPWFDCINTGLNQYAAPIAPGEQRYFRLRL